MLLAETLLLVLLGYACCGLLVGVPFVLRGVERVDPAARGTSLAFRLLLLPGTVALWPLMAAKWRRAAKAGDHT
jgi:hypothetical protein